MSTFARHIETASLAAGRLADFVQLLDEHHVVAWAENPATRVRFGAALGRFLAGMRDVDLCHLHGKSILDIEAFCDQLEHAVIGPPLARRVSGRDGVVPLLRRREVLSGCAPAKFRYFLWHDADALLCRDRPLFSALTDAIVGVAAESEFVDDDLLLLQRLVLIGGPVLDGYAQDPKGQCRSWLRDASGVSRWRISTGVRKPSFLRYHIESGRVEE